MFARTLIVAVAAIVPAAAQAPYTFAKVTDSTGSISFFSQQYGSFAAINNSGQVSFWARLTSGNDAVYLGTTGNLTLIASGTSGTVSAYTDINTAGRVAYLTGTGTTSRLFLSNTDGPATLIAAGTAAGGQYSFIDATAISANDSGRVAFRAGISGGEGVFSSNGSSLTTISTIIGNYGGYGGHSIQNDNTVTFAPQVTSGTLLDGNGSGGYPAPAVLAGSGGALAIRDSASGAGRFFYAPSSGGGQTVYARDNDNGTSGIYFVGSGTSGEIAITGGTYSGFSTPSVNASGRTAVAARLSGGGRQLLTAGPAGTLSDLVLSTGDTLDGATITNLQIGPSAYNDFGQIAFWANLSDGRSGIFIATPVPEPTGVAAVTVGSLLAAGWVRRRRTPGGR